MLRHSAVYGIGHMASRGLGFLLLPLHTNVIATGEYGKAALIFSFLALMNVIYGYGMDVAYLRFVAPENDLKKQKVLFSTGLISLLITSVLFTGLLVVFDQTFSIIIFRSETEALLILLSAGILLFDSLTLMPFMALRAKEKSIPFAVLKVINVVLNIAANILFIVVLKKGVAGIFWANLVSSGLTFLFLLPIIFRYFILKFDTAIFSKLIRFGLPYISSGLAVVAMNIIDRPIIERLTDLETTGIYSAGYKLGSFMALFIAAFRFAWHPFFLSTSKQANAKAVFARVLTYFMLSCSIVFLGVSLFVDEIVRFNLFGYSLFGEKYWASTSIIPLILISNIFFGMYVNFYVGVFLEKKTLIIAWVTGISAGVNILLNFLLIPFFGMLGAAWAKVIAYIVLAYLLYIKSNPLYPIPYEWGRVTKISALALGIFLVQIYFLQWENIFLKIGLILGFFLFLLASGFLDRTEKTRIRKFFKKDHGTTA